MDTDEQSHVNIVHGDISNAFYNMAISTEISELFTLPSAPYGLVRKFLNDSIRVDDQPLTSGDLLVPCLCVLPMGWSWSLHLCQAVLVNAIRRAGHDDSSLIYDKPISPRITQSNVLIAGCVDNFGALTGNPKLAY